MSFLRPEAVAGLSRWREALIGGVVIAIGLWWALTGLGLVVWLGALVAVVGAALLWSGVQRGRFRTASGGLGVVEVTERQVTYLSPVGGGVASVEALTQVDIARDRAGAAIWRLMTGTEVLTIPAAAEGAGALFDVLTQLPRADMEAAIRALHAPPAQAVTVWGHRVRLN
ncbi:hypothetical protein [Maritimibacter sp. DP1N21-5]|uniref:hypothetical protein n=1 Tax=Maritimibacter sp. DP1N21-5 TaxID=2836867 RepID=UPI001C484908|nr:hypothetical protein [Maritimibacter sp. DP1N21-5]MBV7407615.1 hypothetical protein [Maritimibacter sp. DP1N21-5]